jgi:recombination protein RecR
MAVLPKALTELIDSLSKLPGVGPRTAERFAFYLYKNSQLGTTLADKVSSISSKVKTCPITFAMIDSSDEVSDLYSNSSRNKKIIALVAEPFDIVAIEKTGNFQGTYHVLGGLISPIDGVNPENLNIAGLTKRIKDDNVSEIIIAFNASVEGETTALYIQNLIPSEVSITRLARGLPVGLDIEYADQITLGRALEGRTTL